MDTDDTDDDYSEERTMLADMKDTLLTPVRIALSPALLRTYLRTALILITSTLLFVIAVIAYSTFYYTYIPVRGISVPVYLQFDPIHTVPSSSSSSPTTRFPYGIANVKDVVSQQKYDVVVEVGMPRSRRNLEAGNWMVGLEMRGPGSAGSGMKGFMGWEEEWHVEDFSQGGEAGKEKETSSNSVRDKWSGVDEKPPVLARSRRPAILTYRSWMTESAYRVLRLPLYIVGWSQESETVQVKLMESVEFTKGWRNIPNSLRLEIRSTTPLEIYRVGVRIEAKLEGLRWIMHHYRLSSFVVFTALFWGVEMTLVLLTWAIFTLMFSGESSDEEAGEKKKSISMEYSGAATPKTEPASSLSTTPLSDISRASPTLSAHRPLRFTSAAGPSDVKLKGERASPRLEDIPSRTEAEADDEDEDADFVLEQPVPSTAAYVFSDSGIGTGMESRTDRDESRGKGKGVVRRRSAKEERKDG